MKIGFLIQGITESNIDSLFNQIDKEDFILANSEIILKRSSYPYPMCRHNILKLFHKGSGWHEVKLIQKEKSFVLEVRFSLKAYFYATVSFIAVFTIFFLKDGFDYRILNASLILAVVTIMLNILHFIVSIFRVRVLFKRVVSKS